MIRKRSWLLFLLLLWGQVVFADDRIVPLPTPELAQVLESWWSRAGYAVTRADLPEGGIRLLFTRRDASQEFTLVPKSPLASRISPLKSDVPDETQWQRYLEGYLKTSAAEASPTDAPIPAHILSRTESTVCIRALSKTEKDRFSGVLVDAGIILTVAHGLAGEEAIIVTLHDGREVNGVLLRRDPRKDLALIRIPDPRIETVPLAEGRQLLDMGEKIFSIGCTENLPGTVVKGSLNGPPRLVEGLPLLQADMEIHPGSSGSPVFDQEGRLAALVKGRYRGTTTLGFLIPLETIFQFIKESTSP